MEKSKRIEAVLPTEIAEKFEVTRVRELEKEWIIDLTEKLILL